jgi:two-component system phosphate regulon sensor histidine kinase PhoR
MSSVERLQRIERMPNLDKAKYESIFMDFASIKPIQKRLSTIELELLLRQELQVRDIRIPFEYRVFDGNRMTLLGSENYLAYLGQDQFKTPLFLRLDGSSRYELRLAFPGQNRFVISSVLGSVLLSLFFIVVILVVFGVSLSQILKQKKISEIKTDFINNMTHEFKTPIATINLALDALVNPKVAGDQKKILNYLSMIRDENKRMNTQVEHVLQISQLEKKELDLVKENIDPMKTLKQALDHVRLLIDQRQGTLVEIFEPKQVKLNLSKVHMTNVWVNLLENAIKYSPDRLEVTVSTHITNDFFEVQIKDRGKGMSPSVRKRIFDKFYREPSGNIHNVKGHGLGLSYVKQIVSLHSGTISVQSESKQGSVFTVKLPLN